MARRTKLCQPLRGLRSDHAWSRLVNRDTELKGTMGVPKLMWGIRATSEMKNALIRAEKALPATARGSTGAWRVTVCSGGRETATKSTPSSAALATALAMEQSQNCG